MRDVRNQSSRMAVLAMELTQDVRESVIRQEFTATFDQRFSNCETGTPRIFPSGCKIQLSNSCGSEGLGVIQQPTAVNVPHLNARERGPRLRQAPSLAHGRGWISALP